MHSSGGLDRAQHAMPTNHYRKDWVIADEASFPPTTRILPPPFAISQAPVLKDACPARLQVIIRQQGLRVPGTDGSSFEAAGRGSNVARSHRPISSHAANRRAPTLRTV